MAQPDRFTALPPELRLQIYDLVLVRNRTYYYVAENGVMKIEPPFLNQRNQFHDTHPPAILAVSRQIRSEAISVFSKTNDQRVSARMSELTVFVAWISRIVDACGPRPFDVDDEMSSSLVLRLTDAEWPNYDDTLPLAEMMRTTGLHREMLVLGEVRWRRKRKRFDRRMAYELWDLAVGEVLDLGREAWCKGWDVGRLGQEFKSFVEGVRQRLNVRGWL